jgi:hypothetical protein
MMGVAWMIKQGRANGKGILAPGTAARRDKGGEDRPAPECGSGERQEISGAAAAGPEGRRHKKTPSGGGVEKLEKYYIRKWRNVKPQDGIFLKNFWAGNWRRGPGGPGVVQGVKIIRRGDDGGGKK